MFFKELFAIGLRPSLAKSGKLSCNRS